MAENREDGKSAFIRYMTRTVVGAAIGGALIGYVNTIVDHLHGADLGKTLFISGLGALLLGLSIGALNYKRFLAPVNVINRHIRELAAGDLTTRIDTDETGELKPLALTLNQMAGVWQDLIVQIRGEVTRLSTSAQLFMESSSEVKQAIHQISDAIQDVAAGSQEQTAALDDARLTVARINEDIQQVAATASEASRASADSFVLAQAGDTSAEKAALQMQSINSSVTVFSQVIEELQKQSAEIEMMLGVIQQIAEQTRLLSLNASIEAARAGESGRGFAVVAQEIGKLAQESSQSAMRITDLVQAIQSRSSESAGAMRQVQDEVTHGLRVVGETKQAFERIKAASETVAEGTEQISTAAGNVTDKSTSVSEAVTALAQIAIHTSGRSTDVAATVEQQTAFAEQIHDSSRDLLHMANQLEQSLNQFHVHQAAE